jgi:chromate reductase
MQNKIKVLGIPGSLRRDSYNLALLNAAIELKTVNMEITIFALHEIPLYNEDVERISVPEPVMRLKNALAESDGLLIAAPEYNYSIPGVLKNAIDWASRPPANSPLNNMPLGIMGSSGGMSGTAKAQHHLRQVAVFTNMHTMNKPEMQVTKEAEKFKDGRLTDEATRAHLEKFMKAFEQWILIFKNIKQKPNGK